MTPRTLSTALLGLVLALTGCSAPTDASSQPSTSASASAEVDADAPEVDRDPQGELPTITFSAKGIPTMKTVESDPPSVISVKTLTAGDGAVVGSDDYVTVNYAGFLWKDGTQFDSSYDSGEPAGFSLNQVVEGWKYGLAGTKVGDRVVIVVPPDYGYGDEATDSIPAGSTLVFVVDVLSTTAVTTEALSSATLTGAALPDGVTVTGDLGAEPTLTFADGSSAPEEEKVVVIAEGTGAEITDTDTVLYQAVGGYWGGETSSSWSSSYQTVTSGGGSATVGKKVGSRILLTFAADEDSGTQAQALVIDILAAIPASK
ncbi:MAG: FKBP-type peptidyl-prolyl cis-trans isomerase [Propionicimonas sp.]|uniref:FKBP-type peptidyl-prolyl cis-trans isomerase n=1 Tax=Propionicimonas sp. TaxID=1955623 RepID=UPI003D1236F0